MKAVQLNTARADNGGSFRDAGSTVAVGEGSDQILAATAKEWIDNGLAIDAAKAAPAAKATDAAASAKDQGNR